MRRTHRLKRVKERIERRESAVDQMAMDWDDLRALAKDEGINTFGMSRAEIVAALAGGDEE